MKKEFRKIIVPFLIFTGLVWGLTSCEKYLDRPGPAVIPEEEMFKNFRNFQGFVEELYNCIPNMSSHDYHNSWNYGEDEYWEYGITYPFAFKIDQGDYWAWTYEGTGWFLPDRSGAGSQNRNDKKKLWGHSWYGIRKINSGLVNLDKLMGATAEEKNLLAGQLYFFRGWFHFMLMQYWGGLPYISTELPINEPPRLPRLSYQATADSVAKDFERAAALLPVNWDETTVGKQTLGNNNIRINKVMALAYLGKNLLWAGSPLMNRESGGAATYNADYCKRASDAFAQALQIVESTGRYKLAEFSQYRELFYTWRQSSKVPGLQEAIFYENLTANNVGSFRWNQVNDYRPNAINNSGVKVYPTANYVSYYGMANGMPIKDPAAADPESGYDPTHPWRNRDPRFYNDIIYDGVQCVKNASAVNNNLKRQYASLYTGGYYRTDSKPKEAITGFLNKKFTDQYMNDYDGYKDDNSLVLSFMRLADVYLMYAEATANGYGSPQSSATGYNLSAVDAVNKIRLRAGVGEVNARFLGSTAEFMSELRRERAVELAFEGHRFVDLRRWLLLTQRPYTYKKGVEFDRVTSENQIYADPKNAEVRNYRETVIIERQLQDRHYWFPFTRDDVNQYEDFKQNPGWN
ncbi:RagB/SusD family nutrient uptake outer membrane protein [Niabella sp. CJ426]|uniref:RagB/SusD family nutrient uptake outer membrane protein n=1 Tax=Niabella sp. CJ426 TaxID=3393740 RepID=UPI003D08DA50